MMTSYQTTFLLVGAIACKGDKGTGDEASGGATGFVVYPPKGGQGVSLNVEIEADRSVFDYEGATADFGEGITVTEVQVLDGWGVRASIAIEPDAALGTRDVLVGSEGHDWEVPQSFTVIDQSFTIDPDSAVIGETVEIEIVGHNTQWTGGVTWPSFGEGVQVQEFTVLSETLADALVSVESDAEPGWRNVVMDNGGGDLVTLYDGFKVDRVALAATFDPPEAEQGETVEFTIFARGTDFLTETPTLTFFDTYGENPDIVVDSVTVLDAENLFGKMTLSNAAALGNRDVLVATTEEGVLITDAFEVVGGDWSLEEVAIDLYFVVVRNKDNTTGEISEAVQAYCQFYIPLDPPCPTGGGSGSGSGSLDYPTPYDINGVWAVTGSGSSEEEDCPYPTTLSAGDHVWLESEANTITLDKVIDSSTGLVYYVSEGLVLEDYVTDNWYDLHTEGDDEAIGEYLLEDVQPTVPSDWEWLSPDLWGNYTHDRTEDFAFQWTPAMTYPDAMFVVTIWAYSNLGPMAQDEWYGYLGVYPWDDGEHSFTAAEMSQLGAGGVPVYAYSIIAGPEFGLPESIYQDNQAVSYIYLGQYMVLE